MITRLSLSAILVVFFTALVTVAAQATSSPGDQRACPTITVSCPAELKDGEPVIFTASVSGGNPNVKPAYSWEVSAGRIIHGQGSASISVDMREFGGQSPTATVTVRGFDLVCPATASCSLVPGLKPPDSRKLDSFGATPRQNEMARLNVFATQLENEPAAQGYLLVYGGRRGRAGEAQKMATRSVAYLVKTRGLDTGRIVAVEAGFKEHLTIELWVVPTGASPPRAKPTVDPSEIKIRPLEEKALEALRSC